jgi:DNA-binding XRE family transcriptional regulator
LIFKKGGENMPMVDVTDIVLNEEAKELEELIHTNPKARAAYEDFEAEYKLRRELMEARKSEKVTQTELQERTGLTQQMISRIETNKSISPNLRNLIRYVGALGYELTLVPKR